MPSNKTTETPAQAYGRGYRAGRTRERRSRDTVIRALEGQVEHWRRLSATKATRRRAAVVAAIERVFDRVVSSQAPFDGLSRQEFIDEICAVLGARDDDDQARVDGLS